MMKNVRKHESHAEKKINKKVKNTNTHMKKIMKCEKSSSCKEKSEKITQKVIKKVIDF